METTYYLDRRDQLLADLDRAMLRSTSVSASLLGTERLDEYLAAVRREFDALIPLLPYIGGKGNRLTANLVQSAWCLAIYRVLQAEGMPLEQIGELLYQIYSAQLQAFPAWLRLLMGRFKMSPVSQRQLRYAANKSHWRRYPQDWVYDFIPGDGQRLMYGVDYLECGIVKFLNGQGAAELSPYLCRLDFAVCDAFHIHLVRTQTIAEGADHCDFRFYRS